MSKIVLYGWFGFDNLGDDILLKIMIDKLRTMDSVESISVAVHDFSKVDAAIVSLPGVALVKRSIAGLFQLVLHADALVIGPGGLFPHDNLPKVGAFLLLTCWWKALGKKVAYFGLGVGGEQGGPSRLCWRAIARRSNLFVARDPLIFDLAGIGQDERRYASDDVVFALEAESALAREPGRVGVALANLFAKGEAGYASFLGSCVDLVKGLRQRGYTVDLLVFSEEADRQLALDISQQCTSLPIVEKDSIYLQPSIMGAYSAVVGMRFHAVVLSLLADTPVVPVAYSHKTETLAQRFGLGRRLSFYCKSKAEYYEKIIPLDVAAILEAVEDASDKPGQECGEAVLQAKARVDRAFASLKHVL